MASLGGTVAKNKRNQLKELLWPGEPAWLGSSEKGYFCAPRTLPLILVALRDRRVSGSMNLDVVYVELLSNHIGEGIIELKDEIHHAHAAGYRNKRAWVDRMKLLEKAGFIKIKPHAGRNYGFVLLVPPVTAMRKLFEEKQIDKALWEEYQVARVQSKESDPVIPKAELASVAAN